MKDVNIMTNEEIEVENQEQEMMSLEQLNTFVELINNDLGAIEKVVIQFHEILKEVADRMQKIEEAIVVIQENMEK